MTDPQDPTQAPTDTSAVGASVQDTARDIKDRAVREASQHGEQAKAGLASEISDMGNALRRAAGELRDGSAQERSFGQMADALADLSDTVRDKDLGELAEDLSSFARRHPLAALGGAALLGFAGTRAARASRRNTRESVDLGQLWGSDADDDELEAAIVRRPVPAAQTAGAPAAPAYHHTGDLK